MGALTLRDIILRLGLYSMNNVGEFNGILNEEHRDIVSDEVPDTFVGVELDCKPSNIANSVLLKTIREHVYSTGLIKYLQRFHGSLEQY